MSPSPIQRLWFMLFQLNMPPCVCVSCTVMYFTTNYLISFYFNYNQTQTRVTAQCVQTERQRNYDSTTSIIFMLMFHI